MKVLRFSVSLTTAMPLTERKNLSPRYTGAETAQESDIGGIWNCAHEFQLTYMEYYYSVTNVFHSFVEMPVKMIAHVEEVNRFCRPANHVEMHGVAQAAEKKRKQRERHLGEQVPR